MEKLNDEFVLSMQHTTNLSVVWRRRTTGVRVPEAMYRTMPNTHQPRLRLGTTRKESVRSGKRVVPDLKLARLNVNRHDPADITLFHLRPHLSLVEYLTTSGEFFFTITRLPHFHAIILSPIF